MPTEPRQALSVRGDERRFRHPPRAATLVNQFIFRSCRNEGVGATLVGACFADQPVLGDFIAQVGG